MKRRKLYLIAQAAVCCALAAFLSASAISIWREGQALRALDPMADIYTPQVVAERLAPGVPLFLVSLALLIAGLALGIRDERAARPVKDAALARDLMVSRVECPSEAMRRERAAQRRLDFIGWGAFALCMAPVAIYLANPDYFTLDLGAMFSGLIRVFLPWAAVGLGALNVIAALRERSVERETEAARFRLTEEKTGSPSPTAMPADPPKGRSYVQAALVIAAVALIIAGIFNGSARDVLYKAISVCTECVGLG